MNPLVVGEVYTYKDEKYAPIVMHGIVDPDAEGGGHTMQVSVCFQLCTCYKLRDGNELHLLVARGMDVAVNLVLANSWFKRIGAVIDNPAKCLRINGHPDMHKFDLSFHKPRDEKPAISGGELVEPVETQ